jgi:glycosyltransferase involved in cell wall biosynthesis
VIDRVEVARAHGRVDRLARQVGASRVMIHSLDWSREEMPQLYVAAAARSRLPSVAIADEASGEAPYDIRRGRILTEAALAAGQLAGGVIGAGGEAARWKLAQRRLSGPRGRRRRDPKSIVAAWPGTTPGAVGGSVTHAAGILGAFEGLGLDVVLITDQDPPQQLVDAVGEIEVLPAAPPSQRINREVRRLTGNRMWRAALQAAADRLDDPLVYSRHQGMSTAATEVASRSGLPLVLEWNASERWALQNFTRAPDRLMRIALPLVSSIERSVVAQADVVAAVSEQAGQMALAAGARPESVITVPNAVDLTAVDEAVAGIDPAAGPSLLVGWVGSFGAWHGTEVLIEAIARDERGARAVLIGDGIERGRCEDLVQRLGIADRVTFTGRLPHAETLRRLAGCDVLAAPTVPLSGGEPFFGSPTKIFEYMALRRPIVVSRLGQPGEILADGSTALLVEPGSVDELAAAFGRLAGSPPLRSSLAEAARRVAESEHTWEQRAREILAALVATG